MNNTFFCIPDYQTPYELNQEKKKLQFFKKCENFESQADCFLRTIKKYFFEENFDRDEDPVAFLEDHNECMRSEYNNQVKKFNALNQIKILLENLLNYTKNHENEIECDDMELLGLPFNEQKCILLKRVNYLKNCKDMGRKVLKKLQKELVLYQTKEHEMNLQCVTINDLYSSQLKPVKILEIDINNEVTRIKTEFTKKYEKLFLLKLKCERIDEKMRTEIIPKITNTETSLMLKRFDLQSTKAAIIETTKQENLQMKIDSEYEKKLRVLMKEYDKVFEENQTITFDIDELKKSLFQVLREIKESKEDLKAKLTDLCQNAVIDVRISEANDDQKNLNLCYSKNSAICKFNQQDHTISDLCYEIHLMHKQISQSTELIDILQNDLNFLRNEHQKYTRGRDYMGNTIMSPRIEANI